MPKNKQIDLEEAIAKAPKKPQQELHDAFTGELFQPKTRNHYEEPDPVPFAPALNIARPTVRQRVENLLSRGIDPLQDFMRQQAEGDELKFDVPDDPEAPLTPSEQNHLDMLATELAEQAPLPDDGLPRPQPAPSTAAPAGVQGAEPPAPATPPEGVAGPSGPAPDKAVPTR